MKSTDTIRSLCFLMAITVALALQGRTDPDAFTIAVPPACIPEMFKDVPRDAPGPELWKTQKVTEETVFAVDQVAVLRKTLNGVAAGRGLPALPVNAAASSMPPYQADKGRAVSMKPPFLNVTAENSEVVVAAKAPKTVQFAACEATNFLSRVFGAPLPVVNVPSDGKVSICGQRTRTGRCICVGPSTMSRTCSSRTRATVFRAS